MINKKILIISLAVVSIFLIGSILLWQRISEQSPSEKASYVPGEVIVGFRRVSCTSTDALQLIERYGGRIKDTMPQINAVLVKVPIGKEKEFMNNISKYNIVKYAHLNAFIKIPEERDKTSKGGAPAEKIIQKEGEWNTLVDENLGYRVDYPKDWKLSHDVGWVRLFIKSFEKDSIEIVCKIAITPIGREPDLWKKSCAETQINWYSGKIETSPVTIGDTPTLRITSSEFPANITYAFGPNPNTSGKWCLEMDLTTDKFIVNEEGYKVAVEFGKNVMPECEKVLNQMLSTFKFIPCVEENEIH